MTSNNEQELKEMNSFSKASSGDIEVSKQNSDNVNTSASSPQEESTQQQQEEKKQNNENDTPKATPLPMIEYSGPTPVGKKINLSMPVENLSFIIIFLVAQFIILILYAIFTAYPEYAYTPDNPTSAHEAYEDVQRYYPFLQDVSVMIFIGFGYLMTFLKKYGYSSLAFNMMVACFAFELHILVEGFFIACHSNPPFSDKIRIEMPSLINGNFAAGAVLISFGGVLGKVTPTQLLIMATIEVIFYALNNYINYLLLEMLDAGGSIAIHTYGAFFGLACSWVLSRKPAKEDKDGNNAGRYNSDLFAMIGTVFLWIMWPSFNAALTATGLSQKAIVNTVLSLLACTFSTFIFSRLFRKHFEMVDIQNATLAGGVAIGAVSDLDVQPAGAIAIGIVAALISSVGYKWIQPFMLKYFKLHDTCGIMNLHAMPGFLGGVASIITLAIYRRDYYPHGSYQALYNLAALAITLGIAIPVGALTGLLLRWLLPPNTHFVDEENWELPADYEFSTEGHKWYGMYASKKKAEDV